MRALLLPAILLLSSVLAAADQKEGARPILPRQGLGKGMQKGGRAQMGPPLSNPGSPVARLFRASPEDRERALEKLPWRMQEQFRRQLERFDAMPKPQQQVLIRRAERFAALSPEQKAIFSEHMASLGRLPEERRRQIGLAIRRLQPLSEGERVRIVGSDAFKSRFSPDEQKIVIGLSEVMNPPD